MWRAITKCVTNQVPRDWCGYANVSSVHGSGNSIPRIQSCIQHAEELEILLTMGREICSIHVYYVQGSNLRIGNQYHHRFIVHPSPFLSLAMKKLSVSFLYAKTIPCWTYSPIYEGPQIGTVDTVARPLTC